MGPHQNSLKLPKKLIDQLGGEDAFSGGRKRPRPGTRKDIRKAARVEKKSLRVGQPPTKRPKLNHQPSAEGRARAPPTSESHIKPSRGDAQVTQQPKSILKSAKKALSDPKVKSRARSLSPTPKISRAVQDKLAEDDEEIAALEKKLGLKGKKSLPQSFKDDGLDELLEGLDADSDSDSQQKKGKSEGDEWLERKRSEARRKAGAKVETREDEDSSGSDDIEFDEDDVEDSDGESDGELSLDLSLDEEEFPDDGPDDDLMGSDDDEFSSEAEQGFDFDDEDVNQSETPVRVRENPYIAPSAGANASVEKYIPPSLRQAASSDSEALVRIRRRIQGLVNRLTEANLISILGDIEKAYRDNPRQHVTSTLVDILLTSVCEPTSLPDTLIILPAGFIAAVYKIIGTDFGAQVIQKTVELFDDHYSRATSMDKEGIAVGTSFSTKETSNLIMLLSEMYNFQVVGSNLIFDYIRLFLKELSEMNAELLLKIIRTSGPQLRQDDPSSLKDIVTMLRPAIAKVGEDKLSVRTKFMIETINDLKNNKMKTGGAASAVTSEHTIRMKKIIGTLNSRTVKASEPLRIGLKDIRDSDKKGKWWLVGASWSGNVVEESEIPKVTDSKIVDDTGPSDLAQLAREHRMNTDVRRAIFITIMSATDYQDAHLRLMKLKLKKVQEYEIPKVLIHCSGSEKSYNPYYTLIAKKICGDKRLRSAFQFCLWDLFKRMGESDDDAEPEEDEDTLDDRRIVNLAKMFATLVVEGGVSIGVLKNLNLSYLQPKTKTFVEVLLISIFLQSQKQSETKRDERAVASIFAKANDTPQLIRGLRYFLKKVVSKTDIAGGKQEKAIVKWGCKVAENTLVALVNADTAKS